MNGIQKIPLIENIIIIDVPLIKLKNIKSQTLNYIKENNLLINGEIKENYQSSYIPYPHDLDFFQKIIEMSFQNGLITTNEINNIDNSENFISFCLYSKSNLKHITCLKIPFTLELNNKEIITIFTGIALVSPFDIYDCHIEILSKLNNIIIDYYCNFDEKIYKKKVYIDDNYIPEFQILEFYFSFLLNSLNYDINYRKSICISNIDNKENMTFCKFHIDIPENINNILPLKDYNISIILDKFYIEDLVKIYTGLLLDYKIILIFNNYNEINLIIQSLLTITFPLNKSEYQVFSYITLNDEFLINLPCSIIAVHKNLKINFIEKDSIIYSLLDKKFIQYPEKKIPLIDNQYIVNELKSKLYDSLAEKLEINSEMDFELTDLGEMFNNNLCTKINSNIYLNLKICSIFFKIFLLLLKDLNNYIDFKQAEKLFKKNREIVKMSSFFNLESFKKNYQSFHNHFSNTKIFSNFIEKYGKYFNQKPKHIFIHKTITELININNFSKQSLYLDDEFKKQIKQGIIDYYKFKFVNLNNAAYEYYIKYNISDYEGEINLKFPSIEKILRFETLKKKNLWKKDYINFIDNNEKFLSQMELYNYLKE